MKQSTTYTFKYGSDSNSIDLNTMLLSQIHFGHVLSEIKNEIAPGADLSIKIRPLEKGSVPFDIVLNLNWLESLFKPENVDYASDIVSVLVGIITLKLFLKGEKPTSITINDSEIKIEKNGQEIIIKREVYNLYDKSATVDIAMTKAFEAIDKDEEVSNIQILDDNKKEIIKVDRSQFDSLSEPANLFIEKTQKDYLPEVPLKVFKVVFGKGYKWQFYFNDRKISAKMKDESFMERINHGEQFAKGDTLKVSMEVSKVWDKTMQIFIEKDFIITKVLKHIPINPQGKIDIQ